MQTVSFAGSTYNIPNTRGDRPWSGLADFVIAAASKCINTAGGNFTLLANINFGATFGLVSAFYTSRTASAADAGQLRLANTDTIKWRNGLGSANLSLSISSNNLTFEGTKVILSGAIVNADVAALAAIALNKLAATTISRALVSDASGFITAATTTAVELGYVSGVSSAIQTQINTKAPAASPTFTGTVTLPVTADRALQTGTSSVLEASAVTKTELGYVSGVTSAIQTQLGTKVATSGNETITGIKTFSTQAIIKGTATNDSAAAGYVGEYIESVAGATNFGTTTTIGDLTSISLTAGDWDVTAILYVSAAASAVITSVTLGISSTSGNSSTGLVSGSNLARFRGGISTSDDTNNVPNFRVSLSGTTTYYLKYAATYSSGGPPTGAGRLSARRVR